MAKDIEEMLLRNIAALDRRVHELEIVVHYLVTSTQDPIQRAWLLGILDGTADASMTEPTPAGSQQKLES